jgi:hypothetical protein
MTEIISSFSKFLTEEVKILNTGENIKKKDDFDSILISKEINKKILSIFSKYILSEGKLIIQIIGSEVDYEGIKKSDEFKEYLDIILQLQFVDLNKLNKEEIKVMFLNLYNSLQIHLLILNGEPKNSVER